MQGTVLKTENGRSVILSNRLSEDSGHEDFGMESSVYDVCGSPGLVAKIYRFYPSVKKHIHLKKLKKIASELDCPWCLLPVDLLYRDDRPVGFTMKKMKVGMLSEDTLYLGDEQAIEERRLSLKKSYSLDFAVTMLTQIKILNCYGLAVCDFNPNNFSAYIPKSPVVMFDTDSFILDNYFGNAIDDKAFTRPSSVSVCCRSARIRASVPVIPISLPIPLHRSCTAAVIFPIARHDSLRGRLPAVTR